MDNEKIIDVETGGTKEEVLKRRFELIKDIAVASTASQLADVKTYQFAAGIGLWQGLKYRGSLSQGIKAGFAGMVVITGCNVVVNIVKHIDDIKKA